MYDARTVHVPPHTGVAAKPFADSDESVVLCFVFCATASDPSGEPHGMEIWVLGLVARGWEHARRAVLSFVLRWGSEVASGKCSAEVVRGASNEELGAVAVGTWRWACVECGRQSGRRQVCLCVCKRALPARSSAASPVISVQAACSTESPDEPMRW